MKKPDYDRVLRLVDELRNKYKLYSPPIDPVKIARHEGVEVKFVTFDDKHDNISGFYDSKTNTIYVNENESPKRQTFTVAHELAHALLHRTWASTNDYRVMMRNNDASRLHDPYEKEANAFAANLLMPRDLLDKYYELDPVHLARIFSVSVPAIKTRLEFEYGI